MKLYENRFLYPEGGFSSVSPPAIKRKYGPITLQRVDESNFLACFSLQLDARQEEFVSHPIRSLAQAYVYRKQCTPLRSAAPVKWSDT